VHTGSKALKSVMNAPFGGERYPTAPREIGEGVTKVSDQAPHIESFLVRRGIDHDVRDCNGKWVICEGAEHLAGALTVCLF
jgi:hypothetical protein